MLSIFLAKLGHPGPFSIHESKSDSTPSKPHLSLIEHFHDQLSPTNVVTHSDLLEDDFATVLGHLDLAK